MGVPLLLQKVILFSQNHCVPRLRTTSGRKTKAVPKSGSRARGLRRLACSAVKAQRGPIVQYEPDLVKSEVVVLEGRKGNVPTSSEIWAGRSPEEPPKGMPAHRRSRSEGLAQTHRRCHHARGARQHLA